jgi:hypothetical protein
MVELKVWIDLGILLQVSITCVTVPISSGNLDSIVVTHDDNVVVLPLYKKIKTLFRYP